MNKLNSILMIDDDNAHLFLHKRLIDYRSLCDDINMVYSAQDGLAFLGEAAEGKRAIPDLVFLDINMPAVNAWEFMSDYRRFPQSFRDAIVLTILTTSMNPKDKSRAQDFPCIKAFYEKPLTSMALDEIIENNFPHLKVDSE